MTRDDLPFFKSEEERKSFEEVADLVSDLMMHIYFVGATGIAKATRPNGDGDNAMFIRVVDLSRERLDLPAEQRLAMQVFCGRKADAPAKSVELCWWLSVGNPNESARFAESKFIHRVSFGQLPLQTPFFRTRFVVLHDAVVEAIRTANPADEVLRHVGVSLESREKARLAEKQDGNFD